MVLDTGSTVFSTSMNHPAASCKVSHFRDLIDFIEASFEEYNPKRFNQGDA
jgi:hypothetical protein